MGEDVKPAAFCYKLVADWKLCQDL
jgi:hypothetical protein